MRSRVWLPAVALALSAVGCPPAGGTATKSGQPPARGSLTQPEPTGPGQDDGRVAKAAAGAGVRLSGGGATFVNPIMQKWASEYNKQTGVELDYQAKGSGQGIQQLTAKTILFGCSDAPMNKEQLAKATAAGGEVLHLPLIMGAVAVAYNVPGIDQPLHLTGPVIADIYLGKVKKWNDPALAALNPGVRLPDLGVNPVYRSDSSGTSNIFSEYLCKVSPEFKEKVGTGTTPNFKKDLGSAQNGNAGVAGEVKRTPGSVCYTEAFFARNQKLACATVRNKAGKDIAPEAAAVTAAAETATKEKPTAEPYSLHDLTYSLTDSPGDAAYPIAGISYALVFKKQPGDKGKALVEFFKWATKEGQSEAGPLDYATLPPALAERVHEKLNSVELN